MELKERRKSERCVTFNFYMIFISWGDASLENSSRNISEYPLYDYEFSSENSGPVISFGFVYCVLLHHSYYKAGDEKKSWSLCLEVLLILRYETVSLTLSAVVLFQLKVNLYFLVISSCLLLLLLASVFWFSSCLARDTSLVISFLSSRLP